MSELKLKFYGVTDTVDASFGTLDYRLDIEMTTGNTHKEGYCFYKVPWEKIYIVNDEDGNPIPSQTGNSAISFALNLQNVRFEKKMYSPNKIFAEIQIAPGWEGDSQKEDDVIYSASVPKDLLQKSFINKKVSLYSDDKVICDDYFIQNVMPTYKQDAMYVTFEIYSPDYLLTQEEYCRTFVSKMLGSEILDGEIKNYKLPYDSSKTVACAYDNMKHIKKDGKSDGAEHIFPYLVQYNESFYDFMKRSTNRWGEFMYYEDNKLLVGYGYATAVDTDFKKLASSVTYKDLTEYKPKQDNAGKYNTEAPIDDQVLNNPLTKDKYDIVKTRVNSLLDFKNLDGDIYVVKKLAALLNNDKTIYQFLVDTGVDDALDLLKANKISDEKNDAFNSNYFDKKKSDTRFSDTQYDGDKYNQFSEFNPILDTKAYIGIVEKEFASGRNAIEMDFDTTYPNIKLGQIITYDNEKYLVVKVDGYQPERLAIVNNKYVEKLVDMNKVCYKVTAVPQNRVVKEKTVKDSDGNEKTEKVYDYTYYPPVIPEGHIRHSGPQLATISEGTADDPLRQNRVRIKYAWQDDKEWSSPWLLFSPGGGSSKSGVYSWHLAGQKVMVDYIAGNIERPYVVGSVEPKMPAQMKTYQNVFQTPWEQKILMTDGSGAGATAMLASFNPGLKMLQGFWPTSQLPGLDFDTSKNLEGSIEMTDKYGFYSIKGCTNDRNITIKSPWGDVKINAFSGITISAPNGDVKIKGKNVSIEAGANLTLTSGKNIKQKFLMDGEDITPVSIATTVTKTVTAKAASMLVNITDLSLLRHICEVFFKPVEGKIQITSGRYLMLEAGGKKTGYPIEAYKDFFKGLKTEDDAKTMLCVESFELLKGLIRTNVNNHKELYRVARGKKISLVQNLANCRNIRGELQTNKIDDIISALWQNPTADPEETAGFKEQYRKIEDTDDIDWSVMARFLGPGAMRRYFNSTNDVKRQQWAIALAAQRNQKQIVIDGIRELGTAIANLKNFQFEKAAKKYEKLNGLMSADKMPKECLLSGIEKTDRYKLFKTFYSDTPANRKLTYRKLFIELVKSFNFERSALEGGGMLSKPTVFPEPAYNCSDADWAKYVKSIQTLKKKDDRSTLSKVGSAVGDAILDPLKSCFDIKGIVNALDDWTYGSSKKGEILFGTSEGTMVLDKEIYRANVGGLDINKEDSTNPFDPQRNGPATRIRYAMLDANN